MLTQNELLDHAVALSDHIDHLKSTAKDGEMPLVRMRREAKIERHRRRFLRTMAREGGMRAAASRKIDTARG